VIEILIPARNPGDVFTATIDSVLAQARDEILLYFPSTGATVSMNDVR
jgi:hypothetical protein